MAAPTIWSVTSPNGKVKVNIQLKGGSRNTASLIYRVECGAEGSRRLVLADSPLGLRLQDQDFRSGLVFESAQERTVEDRYVLKHGKRRECFNRARQITLAFRNPARRMLELEMRAYDDGVAFRYRLSGNAEGIQRLVAEATGFTLPAGSRIWCAPADKATTYSPAYETFYEIEAPASTVAPLGLGWSFPMLFRTGDSSRWALITEAGVDANFCGCRLSSAPTNGVFTVSLPNPAEGNGIGVTQPGSTLPWQMPWRVVVIGESLGAIVESTLVTDVSPPEAIPDATWVRPGRVAWSWWSDNPSPKDAEKQKRFVDLAAEMGWEYVLVDANWTIMEQGNIHDVLRYAKTKNVGVLLWYNSGGPHNVVTEKPRDTLTSAPVRKFELDLLKSWGVKGIKVDFFQSDKQDVIGLYHGIMQDAAERGIMVNFHGCTLPRGWERTYPHLMSMEAVRGAECYIFDPKYPEAAPVQNTVLPFTRNAVGPMDYTPVTFSDSRYPHKTTAAHELALSVLFESGWLHFADKPEAYLQLPPEPKNFLKTVPVTWDETRFVAGYPGQYAVVARRHDSSWYVAGVNGQSTARTVEVPLRQLVGETWQAEILGDGPTPRIFKTAKVSSQSTGGAGFSANMAPFGGFTAIVTK